LRASILPGARATGIAVLAGILALFSVFGGGAWAQTQPKRPVLIRDTGKAEEKEEPEESKVKPFNPLEAERNIRVGDFYFKRKNYAAAIERYLEALTYQPNLIKAFEALGKAYEKDGKPEKALGVYRDFIEKYPRSPKAKDFQAKIRELEKKAG